VGIATWERGVADQTPAAKSEVRERTKYLFKWVKIGTKDRGR